jgi:hypothetical protein
MRDAEQIKLVCDRLVKPHPNLAEFCRRWHAPASETSLRSAPPTEAPRAS